MGSVGSQCRLPELGPDETVWRIDRTDAEWSWTLVEDARDYERARRTSPMDLDVVCREFADDTIRRVVLIVPPGRACARYLIVAAAGGGPPTGGHLLELLLEYRWPICPAPTAQVPDDRPPGRSPNARMSQRPVSTRLPVAPNAAPREMLDEVDIDAF